ncbi:MAG: peptidase S8/S53 [Cenarchaeum symbiont of Oopsacas minuta]|nr:peptidase S8/S53 [Cenarchaeum symbiont of Oopsacas minuta]
MIRTYYILIFTIILFSPFPFTSVWHNDAFAQEPKITTGPPLPKSLQNQTYVKPQSASPNAINVNSTMKLPDHINIVNITTINSAQDKLMDARLEYIKLNRTFYELNESLADAAMTVLDGARVQKGLKILDGLAVSTSSSLQSAITLIQNGTTELELAQNDLKSNKDQFKISPHVLAILDQTSDEISVYVNLVSHDSVVPLNDDEIISHLDKIILASLSKSRIHELVKHDNIQSIRIPDAVISTAGSFTSQGVSKSRANLLHDMGITGNNITVAVLDVGFTLDAAISSRVSYSAVFGSCSDLTCGDGSHGTSVSHIVADMAPDANLELYSTSDSIGLVNAISHIISRGKADILTISLGVPGLGGDGSTKHFRDGTSHVARIVDQARDAGMLVTVSSGNSAQDHWTGTYVPSLTVTPASLNLDSYQSILEINPTVSGKQKACLSINSEKDIVYLSWDSWDQNPVQDDYDLFLFNDDMTQLLTYSTEWQPIGGIEPLEEIQYENILGNKCLVVASKSSTQDHKLHITALDGPLAPSISKGSIGTPADARGALSVGATFYFTDNLESFSSVGPTDDGRIKPEICGYDGVSTISGGSFFGTSAAAPHIAGMAALLLDANPSATPDEIQRSIEDSAISGPNGCGVGIMSLSDAVDLLPTVNITSGTHHPYVKAGDVITITISTNNTISSANATIFDRSVPTSHTGNTLSASTTVLTNDTQGFAYFTINAIDIFGNLITATPQILTDDNINIDTINPYLESAYASSPTSITIVFSENIYKESVSIDDFTLENINVTDLSVSDNIVNLVTSNLDITALPNVNLSGSIEDLAGNNLSLIVIPTIVGFDVGDDIPPKLVSLSAYSNNTNNTLAKSGDIITVNLTTDDDISSATTTILGKTIQPIIFGNYVIVNTSVLSNDRQGLIDFVLNVKDENNNTLQVTQNNLTSSNVLVDTMPPIISSAKTTIGNTIVLEFNEELDVASVSNTNFLVSNAKVIGVVSIENMIYIDVEEFGINEDIFITRNITDNAGNLLNITYITSTIGTYGRIPYYDGVPPSMISASPLNTSAIKIEFDEILDANTVTASSFVLDNNTNVLDASLLSSSNEVILITTDFGVYGSPSISINGTINDLAGNSAIQDISINLSGSIHSLSAMFTAKFTSISTIEVNFTLNNNNAINLNSTSYNTDAFSITNPNATVLSWNTVPYYIHSNIISDHDERLSLENYDYFGTSLTSADFDKDGIPDLAAGALGDGTGNVHIIYLNSDSTPRSFSNLNLSTNNLNLDAFGTSLASGDFDGDGILDLVIGAPGDGIGGAVHIVYLYSNGSVNSTSELINHTSNNPTTDLFGTSITSSDFDGDGVLDLAIGAPGDENGAGAVHIVYFYSNGSTKSIVKMGINTTNGPNLAALDAFGESLASGDFDGDGVLDLAIGAPGDENGAGAVHIVYFYPDGSVKNTIKTTASSGVGFGSALSTLEDIDGDGRPDLATTMLNQNEGIVYILHPKDDNVIISTSVQFNYGFGTSLAYVGELIDGRILLAIGTPFSSIQDGIDRGTVILSYFGDHIEIKISEINDTSQIQTLTYNANAQSNLTVDNSTVSDGTSAVITNDLSILKSANTVNTSAINVTFSEILDATSVSPSDFFIDDIVPTSAVVFDNVITLITNTIFSSDVTPNVAYVGMIQDISGNIVELRNVTAADKISPSQTSLNISSTNTNNTSYAKIGDTLNITLIASETIVNATAIVLDRNASIVIQNNVIYANITVQAGDTGNVTFAISASDESGNVLYVTESSLTSQNILVDTHLPLLLLNGNHTISVHLGEQYVDMNATVTDDDPSYMGLITSNATSIDTSVIGVQTIVYSASPDLAGNVPVNVTRTVIILNALEISNLTVNTTNANPLYAKTDDTLTITLKSNMMIVNGSAVIQDRPANISISNDTIYATQIINMNDHGDLTFTIIIQDEFGTTQIITENELMTDIFVDTIAPQIQSMITYPNKTIIVTFDESILVTSNTQNGIFSTSTLNIIDLIIKDGIVSSSILNILLADNIATGDTPEILFFDGAFTDFAGNPLLFTSVTASDGIAPTLIRATALSEDQIVIEFSEELSINSFIVSSVNDISTNSMLDGKLVYLSPKSDNLFSLIDTLVITVTSPNLADLAGNRFSLGMITTKYENTLVPYTTSTTTVDIPYNIIIDATTISASDYTLDNNSISTVTLSNNNTIVTITARNSFGSDGMPYVQQIGQILDTSGNPITLDPLHALDRVNLAVIESITTSPNFITVTFTEKVGSFTLSSTTNYGFSGAPIVSITVGDSDRSLLIQTSTRPLADNSLLVVDMLADVAGNALEQQTIIIKVP